MAHQTANSVALKQGSDLLILVLLVHGPEGVDGAAGCKHEPRGPSRVHLQKLGDIVDAVLVCHPHASLLVVMLCDILRMVDGQRGLALLWEQAHLQLRSILKGASRVAYVGNAL